MAKTKKKKKVREEEEIEVTDSEEEELDEDSDEDEGGSKANQVTFGVADLCALIEERTGKLYTTREMRMLLRKLARNGKINREIKAGNRARYDWSGPTDPEVKRVLKAVEAGEIEKGKKEALENLKKSVAEKRAKGEKTGKGKKSKKPEPEDEPEDEEFEEVEGDDEDDDE